MTLLSITLCLLVVVLPKPIEAGKTTPTSPSTVATESPITSTLSPPFLAPDGRQEIVVPFKSEKTFSDGKDVSPTPKILEPVTKGKEVRQ